MRTARPGFYGSAITGSSCASILLTREPTHRRFQSSDVLPQARRELDDEEAAAFAGLRDFLHSLAADRKLAREHNGRVTVRLSYAA